MRPHRIMIIGYPSHAMTSRLHDALTERGHRSRLVDPDRLATVVSDGTVTVLPEVGRPDAVMLTTSTDHLTALQSAAQLQRAGIPVFNSPAATLLAADKIATTVTLARAGLPVPRTVSVASLAAATERAALLGYPVVLKAADGAEGNQARLVRTADELPGVFENLRASMGQSLSDRTPLLLQEQLGRALGRDRRLFVVGGHVQAAMDRVARRGEWRSNLSQGAAPYAATATTEEIAVAEGAAAALGLDFTTIDLMAGERGPVVIEANAFGDVLDVAMMSGLDLIGSLADLVEIKAGARPAAPIRPRRLEPDSRAALTAMCRRRWNDKLAELDRIAEL
ncbi:hypothetical protein GCM10022204_12440 [Microlunatus aurantiacus]|uniref:ATP-grasp domain-containing protein n=1 Tax=Microlunatus aurantiacus TaxID=446786 RepID=A0ABP7D120_9ACTN